MRKSFQRILICGNSLQIIPACEIFYIEFQHTKSSLKNLDNVARNPFQRILAHEIHFRKSRHTKNVRESVVTRDYFIIRYNNSFFSLVLFFCFLFSYEYFFLWSFFFCFLFSYEHKCRINNNCAKRSLRSEVLKLIVCLCVCVSAKTVIFTLGICGVDIQKSPNSI